MSFEPEDFHELVRLLEQHPEWRADLRRFVLSEELLALPEQFALFRVETERRFQELIAVQQRMDEQLIALTVTQQRMDEQLIALTAAQQRTDEQIAALTRTVQTLVGEVEVLKDDVKVLKDDVRVLKDDVRVLKDDVKIIKVDLGDLKGDVLELRFREKAPAYLGPLLRRAQVLSAAELAELLENATEQGLLTEEEK